MKVTAKQIKESKKILKSEVKFYGFIFDELNSNEEILFFRRNGSNKKFHITLNSIVESIKRGNKYFLINQLKKQI